MYNNMTSRFKQVLIILIVFGSAYAIADDPIPATAAPIPAIVVNPQGLVGIGTPTPSSQLEINGDVTITGSLRLNGLNGMYAILQMPRSARTGPQPPKLTIELFNADSTLASRASIQGGVLLDESQGVSPP